MTSADADFTAPQRPERAPAITPPAPPASPYDAVPYGSQAFAQTHPDRLATLARVFGLATPPITACRVLELGCASGGNLLPMACALPGSEFVGVDLSARHVEQANATIERLGLANARVAHASITDIDASWGRFDYIVCHGVYSWVEPAVRDAILAVVARHLAEDGVAYVSYNTYPGWHMRESVRHMMRYHATPFEEPAERIGQARALLDFLASAVPAEGSAYGQMLAGELDLARRVADWYLYHEHLEPTNNPLYFHQFIEHAGGHGLQYLAEADFSTMLTGRFEPPVAATLERISADVIHLEQYMDFVANRHFRQTLLCHAARTPRRALSPALLHGFHVAASALQADASAHRSVMPEVDLRPGVPVTFKAAGRGQVTTRQPLVKAAFALLGERWPRGWPVEELVVAAHERAADWIAPEHDDAERAQLMQDLFQCFLSGVAELRTWQPPCASAVHDRPRASRWAAAHAAIDAPATSLRHTVIALDAFSRAVLSLLDGERDRAALREALYGQFADGSLVPVTPLPPAADDAEALRAFVAARLDQSLRSLAWHGLLAG